MLEKPQLATLPSSHSLGIASLWWWAPLSQQLRLLARSENHEGGWCIDRNCASAADNNLKVTFPCLSSSVGETELQLPCLLHGFSSIVFHPCGCHTLGFKEMDNVFSNKYLDKSSTFKYVLPRPVTRGAQGGRRPHGKFFAPPGKMCWI